MLGLYFTQIRNGVKRSCLIYGFTLLTQFLAVVVYLNQLNAVLIKILLCSRAQGKVKQTSPIYNPVIHKSEPDIFRH